MWCARCVMSLAVAEAAETVDREGGGGGAGAAGGGAAGGKRAGGCLGLRMLLGACALVLLALTLRLGLQVVPQQHSENEEGRAPHGPACTFACARQRRYAAAAWGGVVKRDIGREGEEAGSLRAHGRSVLDVLVRKRRTVARVRYIRMARMVGRVEMVKECGRAAAD